MSRSRPNPAVRLALGTLAFLAASAPAHASRPDTYGAVAAVCRLPATAANPAGQIVSARLYDLYEANVLASIPMPAETASVDDQLASIVARVGAFDSAYGPVLEKSLASVKSAIQVVSAALTPNNANVQLVHPVGCAIESLSEYVDYNYTNTSILVSQELWNALPPSDRAALYLHEAIYEIELAVWQDYGDYGTVTADHTRSVVATLMSGEALSRGLFVEDWWVTRCRQLSFSLSPGTGKRSYTLSGTLTTCADATCATNVNTPITLTRGGKPATPVIAQACWVPETLGAVTFQLSHVTWKPFSPADTFDIEVIDVATGKDIGDEPAETDDVGDITLNFQAPQLLQ